MPAVDSVCLPLPYFAPFFTWENPKDTYEHCHELFLGPTTHLQWARRRVQWFDINICCARPFFLLESCPRVFHADQRSCPNKYVMVIIDTSSTLFLLEFSSVAFFFFPMTRHSDDLGFSLSVASLPSLYPQALDTTVDDSLNSSAEVTFSSCTHLLITTISSYHGCLHFNSHSFFSVHSTLLSYKQRGDSLGPSNTKSVSFEARSISFVLSTKSEVLLFEHDRLQPFFFYTMNDADIWHCFVLNVVGWQWWCLYVGGSDHL